MATGRGQFAVSVREFAEKAQGNADQVLRAVSIELLNRIVLRSPVGNPELWASNKQAAEGRRANIGTMSRRALEKSFPFASGKGYTGGRFRGNWQVTLNGAAAGELDRIDPSGAQTLAEGIATISGATSGATVYMVNNLPYAQRLEFDAWSSQAPAGMVRITVAEFPAIVEDAARALDE